VNAKPIRVENSRQKSGKHSFLSFKKWRKIWSGREDSNLRLLAPKASLSLYKSMVFSTVLYVFASMRINALSGVWKTFRVNKVAP